METLIPFPQDILASHDWLAPLLAIAAIAGVAIVANWITKRIVVRLITRLIAASPFSVGSAQVGRVVRRLSNIVPAFIIQQGVTLVPDMPATLVTVTQNVAGAFIVLTIALSLSAVLDVLQHHYDQRPDAASRPIKGYVQVAKILIFGATAILVLAALMDRSPLLLLSGLGAMAAVLMLVFRDTILSLVASVQLRSNDMLRVGDWIEMPQLNANGDVVDIALHTVKVQNWDKTITTIPTHRLIDDSFRNWRSMFESGGRRIMRALHIDQTSIDFMSAEQWERMRCFRLLRPYVERKEAEIAEWNARLGSEGREAVNARRPTNIGTFRAYVQAYLKSDPRIAQDKFLLVRQLAPTATGLPIEIYCFTGTTAWADYEAVQSDIFDHMLAILPEFGLRLFQEPTGRDMRRLAQGWREQAAATA